MDALPPVNHYLAAKQKPDAEKSDARSAEKVVSFTGGSLTLYGEGWIGPMKALVPGWTNAFKYGKGPDSVVVCYRNSEEHAEKLRDIVEAGKVDREAAQDFVKEKGEGISGVKVDSIDRRRVVLIETEYDSRRATSIITTGGARGTAMLVKIIVSSPADRGSKLADLVSSSIKFAD